MDGCNTGFLLHYFSRINRKVCVSECIGVPCRLRPPVCQRWSSSGSEHHEPVRIWGQTLCRRTARRDQHPGLSTIKVQQRGISRFFSFISRGSSLSFLLRSKQGQSRLVMILSGAGRFSSRFHRCPTSGSKCWRSTLDFRTVMITLKTNVWTSGSCWSRWGPLTLRHAAWNWIRTFSERRLRLLDFWLESGKAASEPVWRKKHSVNETRADLGSIGKWRPFPEMKVQLMQVFSESTCSQP